MGLFDNIIGTASEDIEPLGMEAITDDSKVETGSGTGTGGSGTGTGGSGTGTGGSGTGTGGSGTGTGGSGTGTGESGTGTGESGTGTGESGTGNNIDTMINIGNLSSSNTPNIPTNSGNDDIPNIDIGGDMDFSSLGINTEETNKSDEVVLMADTVIETPKVEINNEVTINTPITDTTSSIQNIAINIDTPESKTTEDTINTLIPTETTQTFSLLDNSAEDTTPVTITEPIVEATTLTTTSLIDIVPESAKEESIMAPIPETIPTVETTPTNNISPLSSLNLGHQKNTQDNTNHEPLSVRIAAFLKELEELKSNDEVTRAKLEQELIQIREDEKKINDAINLLNNIKNI